MSINVNLTTANRIHSKESVENRSLTGTSASTEGNFFSLFNVQSEIIEGKFIIGNLIFIIGKLNILERNGNIIAACSSILNSGALMSNTLFF